MIEEEKVKQVLQLIEDLDLNILDKIYISDELKTKKPTTDADLEAYKAAFNETIYLYFPKGLEIDFIKDNNLIYCIIDPQLDFDYKPVIQEEIKELKKQFDIETKIVLGKNIFIALDNNYCWSESEAFRNGQTFISTLTVEFEE